MRFFFGCNGVVLRFVIVNQIVDRPHKPVAGFGGLVPFFVPKVRGNEYIRMIDNFLEIDRMKNGSVMVHRSNYKPLTPKGELGYRYLVILFGCQRLN